jgi:hypothetical protein
MKTGVIKFLQLDIRCWLPMRYLGSCENCQYVKTCKLPEALHGRKVLAERRVEKARAELTKREKELRDLEAEIGAIDCIRQ